MSESAIIEVGESDFEHRVLETSQSLPVVVDFWAGWCQPCLVLSPMLERLAREYEGKFVLAKVDVDANPGLASSFRVQGIPAVKAFRDGQVVSEFVGVQPEQALRAFIGDLVPSRADELALEAGLARRDGHDARAEALYREALSLDPHHQAAKLGLASSLALRGEEEEAQRLLAALPPTDEVRQLVAALELRSAAAGEIDRDALEVRADAGDLDADLALATADAARGDYREALERALRVVTARAEQRDHARGLMLRIFDVLGDEHPLTRDFRPRLASALF